MARQMRTGMYYTNAFELGYLLNVFDILTLTVLQRVYRFDLSLFHANC